MGQAFGCIQVHHSTVAVKEKHGKYDNVLKPGCYCLPWCLGHHVAGKVSSRVQQLEVRCEAKTKDDAFVNVFACIQYHVMEDKANDAFYKLSDAKGQIQAKGLIQANVFNVITANVLKRNWDSAFEKKDDIAKDVKEKLEESMSAYGFKIDQVLITNIEPDITVKKAMNERTAEAIKSAAKIKAEPEKISQIKPAEGEAEAETTEPEKISQIKPAKGEAEAETISQIKPAKGEAEPETISQIKPAEGEAEPAEGEAEPEKISQIKPAEGEAEPETISQIKPAEGEAEPEKISQIKPAKGEADPA